jgi:hypothetical protein
MPPNRPRRLPQADSSVGSAARTFVPNVAVRWYASVVSETPPPDRTLEQRQLLLEQVERRLEIQFDELDGLDRKATTVLAATGVTLGLVINNVRDFASSPCPVPWVFYGALVVLAVGLIAGVAAMWPRNVEVVPDPEPFLEQHGTNLPEATVGELVSTKALAFAANHKIARRKGDQVRNQMVLLALGGSLLVGAYILERLV